MSYVDKIKEAIKDYRYAFVFVPAFVLLLTDLIIGSTPVFDPLSEDFSAFALMFASAVCILGLFNAKEEHDRIKRTVLPVIAGAGILIFLETGTVWVIETVILVILLSLIDIRVSASGAFTLLCCVSGASFICAHKGFIRDYTFYGINAFGFRSLVFLVIAVLLEVVSAAILIILYHRKRETKKSIVYLIYAAAVSAVIVTASLKALNLHAAVEAGKYEIYPGNGSAGIEVRMEGFEDYDIELGSTAPSVFDITPEGDHYMITFDSYGVTKTLCVIDGNPFLGNYDQSADAHLWDIVSIPGTPYFTVTNAETGLVITAGEDGLKLSSGEPDETSYLRIGSENLDYFESTEEYAPYDLHDADITCSSGLTYSGSEVTTEGITVELNGRVLTEGVDYSLDHWDNYLPGTAHITVTGEGEYSGSCGADFEIVYDNNLDMPFYRNTADYVVNEYRMAYMRFPSPDEVYVMSQTLIDGDRTPDSVVWELYRNGTFDDNSDASFVEAVYRLMLLRNGSRGELENWIGALNSGYSRSDIISEISNSPDYQSIWHNFGAGFR